ncbi:hypothetical protein Y032_0057g2830 [Ancylostoma ceylanicum]|uniref:Uncharacterized protein n=1 Tax=Ancylostoma ceylanicum TaxID=53326 RepID=A0A016U5V1_9BILA|nr:hypothetical protein Y032_0057g2830 [Ancylostoma ceylanicum]
MVSIYSRQQGVSTPTSLVTGRVSRPRSPYHSKEEETRSNTPLAGVVRMPARTDRLRLCTNNVCSITTKARLADSETVRTEDVAGRWRDLFSGAGSSRFSARKTRNTLFVSVR